MDGWMDGRTRGGRPWTSCGGDNIQEDRYQSLLRCRTFFNADVDAMPTCDARSVLTPRRALVIFTFINLINYIDRGVIPGAGTDIKGCIYNQKTMCPTLEPNKPLPKDWCITCPLCNASCASAVCGNSCNEDTHKIEQIGFGVGTTKLGILQSSFMFGYSIAALVFGNLVHRHSKFKLMGVGLSIWTLAVLLSGLSGLWCKSEQAGVVKPTQTETCSAFYLMVFARIISGVGEASFATISVPLLDDIVDQKSIGLYLAIYFSAVPVGTAFGFIWGGQISKILGWEWAFLFEVPLMLPAAILFFSLKGSPKKASENTDRDDAANGLSEDPSSNRKDSDDSDIELMEREVLGDDGREEKLSFFYEIKLLLSHPVYVASCLGYAAYTAVVAGFAFYAPQFLQKNNPCLGSGDPSCVNSWNFTQLEADKIFGAIVASAGLLGTVIGGKLLDCVNAKQASNHEDAGMQGERRLEQCRVALFQISIEIFIAIPVCFFAVQSSNPGIFFAGIAFGCLALFTTTAGVNGALLWSIPSEHRSMALGLSVLFIHALGDVPSPIAIGLIDDVYKKPVFTMSVTTLWLLWALFFWCFAYCYAMGQTCHPCARKDGFARPVEDSMRPLINNSDSPDANPMDEPVSYSGLMD